MTWDKKILSQDWCIVMWNKQSATYNLLQPHYCNRSNVRHWFKRFSSNC